MWGVCEDGHHNNVSSAINIVYKSTINPTWAKNGVQALSLLESGITGCHSK